MGAFPRLRVNPVCFIDVPVFFWWDSPSSWWYFRSFPDSCCEVVASPSGHVSAFPPFPRTFTGSGPLSRTSPQRTSFQDLQASLAMDNFIRLRIFMCVTTQITASRLKHGRNLVAEFSVRSLRLVVTMKLFQVYILAASPLFVAAPFSWFCKGAVASCRRYRFIPVGRSCPCLSGRYALMNFVSEPKYASTEESAAHPPPTLSSGRLKYIYLNLGAKHRSAGKC